jgi:hypothetical protein
MVPKIFDNPSSTTSPLDCLIVNNKSIQSTNLQFNDSTKRKSNVKCDYVRIDSGQDGNGTTTTNSEDEELFNRHDYEPSGNDTIQMKMFKKPLDFDDANDDDNAPLIPSSPSLPDISSWFLNVILSFTFFSTSNPFSAKFLVCAYCDLILIFEN